MTRPWSLLAGLFVLFLFMATSPVHATCFIAGPCTYCCDSGAGGCLYSPQADSCWCYCSTPGENPPGDEHPDFPGRPDCHFLPDGQFECDYDEPWFDSATVEPAGHSKGGNAAPSREEPGKSTPGEGALLRGVAALADRLGAVAILRGRTGSIEIVPADRVAVPASSEAPAGASRLLSVHFKGMDVAQALRMTANASGLDIVLPRGFAGSMSGDFTNISVLQLLEKIAGASRGGGHIRFEPDGLVRID